MHVSQRVVNQPTDIMSIKPEPYDTYNQQNLATLPDISIDQSARVNKVFS